MWAKIASYIVRNRIAMLLVMIAITAFMGYKGSQVELSYEFPQVVPQSDPDYVYYTKFKQQFGEDGNTFIIGFQSDSLFKNPVFSDWYKLGEQIRKTDGVANVTSLSSLFAVEKDAENKKFLLNPVVSSAPVNQSEVDSIRAKLASMPFYHNLIYNLETNATFMVVSMQKETLLTKDRVRLLDEVKAKAEEFGKKYQVGMHYSGLPYIRTTFANKIQQEINFFLFLSVAVTSIILLLFFRSVSAVIFPLITIAIILIWSMGVIVLFGYKITLLTALVPPLIVIIGVPNFVYFLNRYHTEYRKYGDKFTAIIRMVENIAQVIFLNNVTTAIGFGVLYFVDSPVLKEFGVIAFTMVTATYIITLVLLPIVFSYLKPPSSRHVRYLNNPRMKWFLEGINWLVHKRRKTIYITSIALFIVSILGLIQLKPLGYILDDVPKSDRLYRDLSFFEDNFKGIMPFEVTINTGQKNGLMRLDKLQKIEQVQDSIEAIPEFSSTLSIVDVVKFARQAFYNNSESKYGLPSSREQAFLLPYLRGLDKGEKLGNNMVDSNFQTARISARMADAGSVRLKEIEDKLNKVIPKIFDDNTIKHRITGYSIIFLRGTEYLIENLIASLAMAIALIAFVVAWLFRSLRILVFILIPNLLALFITAGIMGFFDIHLKASTILVFSIAFGIAVDASFHFVVRYRQDLKLHNWDVGITVTRSLFETGFSIAYTTFILFFGFGIFCFSSFGSTVALGALTSITLLCAMFTNIILIPALLLSFDKRLIHSKISKGKIQLKKEGEN